MFENPRRSRQARNFTTKMFPKFYISNRLPKRYFSENCRWVPLLNSQFQNEIEGKLNLSCENEFYLHEIKKSFSYFNMKRLCTWNLALKRGLWATRKWPRPWYGRLLLHNNETTASSYFNTDVFLGKVPFYKDNSLSLLPLSDSKVSSPRIGLYGAITL